MHAYLVLIGDGVRDIKVGSVWNDAFGVFSLKMSITGRLVFEHLSEG